MASAYSQDLRDRVTDAVIRGGMSRRAAAARFGVSESSAIKWVQRFERSGSRAASRMGGYLRPKLERHREFLEALRGEKSGERQSPCSRALAAPRRHVRKVDRATH
jgi:transposase